MATNVLFALLSECMHRHDIFLGTVAELMLDRIKNGDTIYVLVDYNNVIEKSFFNPQGLWQLHYLYNVKVKKLLALLKIPAKQIISFKKNNKTNILNNINFKTIDELKNFSINQIPFGEGVASSLISFLGEHEPDLIQYRAFVNSLLQSSFCIYEFVINCVKDFNIELMYFFNGRCADQRAVLEACKISKVQFFTYEMGETPYSYCLFKNTWVHDINYVHAEIINAWGDGGEQKEKIAKNWFFARREGRQGRLSYCERQVKYWLPTNFDCSKRNIIIFNSSIYEYAAMSEWKNPVYKDENEGIKEILESFKENSGVKFYLRIHPHLWGMNNTQVDFLKKFKYKNLEIIWPENQVDSYELMMKAGMVLVFGSTTGIEACFWKIPVILVGRCCYENLNCCYRAKNHAELINLINSNLEPKNAEGALKYGYWNFYHSIPYKYFNSGTNVFEGKALSALTFKERCVLKIYSILDGIFHD